ncbi:LysR family transcriptional regulator [Marinomonas sp. A3A]|uniref:LysR family transcriptional regulator n=1 Tax=unclassified Marinomonas TaxID=196814 RepID=UPI001BB3F822|nr:LysR family transcriptional regulator [Marinomonas sp. A3A]QUX92319.1 LysR family transcriptional regulator [Marinomonas sp. A3A]
MSLPPLYALRAFEAAARYGSFTRAADHLNLTTGAISKHIRTLEVWFGCELFKRKGPKVEVTSAGSSLAGQISEGFNYLERACSEFRSSHNEIRLKAPSTITMRWLLDNLHTFHEDNSTHKIETTSVWMDIDTVNFSKEPYDCAILLGNGVFGQDTECALLFLEWLIPICAPNMKEIAHNNLENCSLIHPSPDKRDWRRWLKGTQKHPDLHLAQGKIFDTLEQGNMAAMCGHGVSIGDLLLSADTINNGLLATPFNEAIATGDGYYLVWPKGTTKKKLIDQLFIYLKQRTPNTPSGDIVFLI